jgi:hypothetical protein
MKPATLAILSAGLLGLSSPGFADTISITFTGTVFSPVVLDQTNIFGGAAFGDPFSETLVFNTAIGSTTGSADMLTFSGAGATSPLVSESVTINGHTAPTTITGSYSASLFICSSCSSGGKGEINFDVEDKSDNGATNSDNSIRGYITTGVGNIASPIPSPFNAITAGDTGVAYVQFYTTSDNPQLGTEIDTNIEGLLTGLSLSSVGAVPEPSTWVLSLLGFVGVGLLVCRRKSKSPATTWAPIG